MQRGLECFKRQPATGRVKKKKKKKKKNGGEIRIDGERSYVGVAVICSSTWDPRPRDVIALIRIIKNAVR